MKEKDGKLMVMSGNHRVMAGIELIKAEIKILLVCDQNDSNCIESLQFHNLEN